MKLAVIGIGQSLRGDDAAGIVAVRQWSESHPSTAERPDIITEYIELPGLNLLDILDNVEGAILVDAVRSSAAAGFIHRLDQDQILAFGKGTGIAHGWGVAETLALARKLNLPSRDTVIKLVGIEAAQVELGRGLSPDVERAIPAACDAIEAEVSQFLG